jgi:hypothetical protein
MRDVFPDRFVASADNDQALAAAVARAGRDKPAKWIRKINPGFRDSMISGPHQINCEDAVRAYVQTRQTDVPMSASGDAMPDAPNLLNLHTGVPPRNTIYAQGLDDVDDFQVTAWDQVARQLDGHPPGTVSMVFVAWEPYLLNGVPQRAVGHYFGAEVGMDGKLKWVDPQAGTYKNWPPRYPTRVIVMESVYRRPDDLIWRADGPVDPTRSSSPIYGAINRTPAPPPDQSALLNHAPYLSPQVGQPDAVLAARLAAEPHAPAASTFLTPHEADAWTNAVLARNEAAVDNWLANTAEPQLILNEDFTGGPATGLELRPGEVSSSHTNAVRLVLERRPPGMSSTWRIIDATPYNAGRPYDAPLPIRAAPADLPPPPRPLDPPGPAPVAPAGSGNVDDAPTVPASRPADPPPPDPRGSAVPEGDAHRQSGFEPQPGFGGRPPTAEAELGPAVRHLTADSQPGVGVDRPRPGPPTHPPPGHRTPPGPR